LRIQGSPSDVPGRRAGCRSIPIGSYLPPDARSSMKQWAAGSRKVQKWMPTNASDRNHLPVADRIGLLRQKHHTAPACAAGAEPISAGSRSLQSFPPLHAQFQDSMALKPLLHLTKAGIAPTGQPLKDSARSSTVRVMQAAPGASPFPSQHCERNTASRCPTIL